MSPKEFFGAEPAFSKNHDQTLELIAAGTFECGAVDYSVYDDRVKKKTTDPDVVQVVWVTPEVLRLSIHGASAARDDLRQGLSPTSCRAR